MSDYLSSLGPIGFTYRTRRLADRLADGGRRLYESLDLPLEPNWHAMLLYLDRRGPAAVTQLANELKVSHPAVSEMARRIESAGLIESRPDPADRRRKVLALSREGKQRMDDFQVLWAAAAAEIDDMIEATAGSDAMGALATLEAELDREEIDARVRRHLAADPGDPRPRAPEEQITIRAAEAGDRDGVVHIARELVRSADTYAYDPAVSDDELWRYWNPLQRGNGYVALLDRAVAGIFVIRPNIPGPGAHVANASYAVRADVRGIGLGRQMGEASLRLAVDLGYRAMQFNTVVSTNASAVRLWRSLGFRIVGTVPDGFRLPDGTTVAHHVMYRAL